MNVKKWGLVALVAMLVAAVGLVGCSSQGGSAKAGSMKLLKEGTLTVGTSPDYPPFEFLENGDQYAGYDIDLIKAVGDKLGLKVEYKTIQFDGIIAAVVAGGQCDVGISGFSIDPDRAKEIDFTDGYYTDDIAIAATKGGDITSANVDTALNAAGIVIAVQSGTTGETFAQENYPNATVQAYGNGNDIFAAMQAGQVQAACTNKSVVDQMIATAYTDAEVVKNVATGEEYAIVVSKDNPELTKAINGALADLKKDGTIDKLMSKYF